MRILILGSDGYIGYPLTINLLKQGHKVLGVDNYSRRTRVDMVGSDSLTPIISTTDRNKFLISNFKDYYGSRFINLGLDDANVLDKLLDTFQPESIVHLAEQPSAPWSMIDELTAKSTQLENVIGTLDLLWTMRKRCPNAHLIKLGTMGEYGTPNCNIPEGFIPNDCLDDPDFNECPMKGLLFPRQPGSFYHLSKVHDTYNVKFACDTWGLRSTDIMQGVLFGVTVDKNDPIEAITRFDYDEYFGTAINRFCAQVLADHPLTIYGKGNQTRGYLPLKDAIQCLTIAINNPPGLGEYRTWNQFDLTYSINQLAKIVEDQAYKLGIKSTAGPIDNPRVESEDHYYNPCNDTLFNLGYIPTRNIENEINYLLKDLISFKSRIIKDVIMPKTTWR